MKYPEKAKKLLIWDGDCTLWQGTIVEGDTITIPPERLAFVEELSNKGVLQSIASANLIQDVEKVLHRYGIGQYFLANRADFSTSKPAMIRAIMDDLNLARPEDVVFIDDNWHNVYEVESVFGQAIECLSDPTDYDRIRWLFSKPTYTDEDRNRVAMYRAEQARKNASRAYGNDRLRFLESCQMKAVIRHPKEDEMTRVWDLVRRANRLGAVYGAPKLEDIEESRQAGDLYVLEASDNYGSYGLSAVAVARKVMTYETVIPLLVVSCRLQGKGYGSALLGWLINNVAQPNPHQGNMRNMVARWQVTEYNVGVADLFGWYGFNLSTDQWTKTCTARLSTTGVSLPHWITIDPKV